ncbi:hypothetical protein CHCC20441_1319 [Bacillus licheniformis]|uniref:Uncharacterized protein n=1 Tax=Bacillus licheniformis TaxID=1402 RepID=A0A8B5YC20_BACLI|nr:hypothetical protein B4092_4419 [Bacillus licheniformis]TWN11274.1 hypothetical protein CHCC14564_3826 [Bacillus licheniformis LMG 17339]KYC78234.1 hypothetical protein B4090_4402 [Bacillus licheniformis]KYC82072.1 hypothetical protein B4091_4431 [Bacillus licheniformis]KYD02955.1 hypothetical protein B4164_4272 [Bacillus licheniformis]
MKSSKKLISTLTKEERHRRAMISKTKSGKKSSVLPEIK